MSKTTEGGTKVEELRISEPKMETAIITICGFAPLVIHRFGQKQRAIMEAKMKLGDQAKKNRSRAPRDFDEDYENAKYISEEGWCGIPASSFRNSLISACRLVGFTMTRAKLSIFVEANGFDRDDKTPLVRISKGEPHPDRRPVRNETGVADIRCRPMWEPGWEATVPLSWDSNQFSMQDVFNLMARAGLQVGIGEGRPDSKESNGIGFGRWRIEGGIASVTVREFH